MSRRKLTRRSFLKTSLISAIQTTIMGVGGYAYGHEIEPDRIEVRPVRLTLPRLSPAFDGYRVVQFSDIHMDHWMTRARLEHIVALVNRQKPDLVAITGDFVTFDPEGFAGDLITTLRDLTPEDAIVAVLGNHDHWTDADAVREIVQESGIVNVSNDVYTLRRDDEALHFAGVDDVWEGQDRLDLVLEKLADDSGAILLAHEPDYADTSATTGRFDLQISGHSHGGQVNIPFMGRPVLPLYGEKYPAGQYRVGNMIQYTNRGVGMIVPQVRFNCRPEITVFTLEAPAPTG